MRLSPVVGVLLGCLVGCGEPPNLSTFAITPPPESLRSGPWIPLAQDQAGDGDRSNSADGKSFAYHYDPVGDTIWFRLELYDGVDPERPAASVSFDLDSDQGTGIPWYGANRQFTFEKMLSVGPTGPEGALFRGYNGITNQDGVTGRNWINERQGVVVFHLDVDARTYYLGVARRDIDPGLRRAHVIGSVGAAARWNDDIGEQGYGTIELDPEPRPKDPAAGRDPP